MNLPIDGREYVKWGYAASAPITSADVSFDNDPTWYPLVVTSTTVLTGLVAGSDATANPSGTIVLGVGTHPARIRFNDAPEVVIRPAGIIAVD